MRCPNNTIRPIQWQAFPGSAKGNPSEKRGLKTFPPGQWSLLVTTPDGSPLRRSNFRRRIWLPVVKEAGLAPLTYHHLRHSHAALLVAQGEHPQVIADRLGHASPNVTNAIYSHSLPGLDQQAAERLDQGRNRLDDRLLTDFPASPSQSEHQSSALPGP